MYEGHQYRGYLRQDGTLRCPGVDYGCFDPEVLYRNGNYYVLRVKGSTQWSRVGQTQYYPTVYALCKQVDPGKPINADGWGDTYVALKQLEEHEPGRHWKRCLDMLKGKADNLAGERL